MFLNLSRATNISEQGIFIVKLLLALTFFDSIKMCGILCCRYIKMSSPYLNNLIIVGCMLTYTSVIFLGLDSQLTSVTTFPYICTARAWLLMSGFSLAFGSMFSKTWRVHSIFTDVKINKKVKNVFNEKALKPLFMLSSLLIKICM